jgi:hypothetical protein
LASFVVQSSWYTERMIDDLSWAVGLFEGEGCFTVSRGGGYQYGRAYLVMSDEDVVRRFAEIVGCGKVCIETRQHRAPHHKTMYRWQASSRADFAQTAELLGPHLGQRRRAKLAEIKALPTKMC